MEAVSEPRRKEEKYILLIAHDTACLFPTLVHDTRCHGKVSKRRLADSFNLGHSHESKPTPPPDPNALLV